MLPPSDSRLEPSIIFEDQWLAALHKPAGWVVNRADSVHEATIQDWLEKRFEASYVVPADSMVSTVFIERSGVAHRLDKDTSGVLLVAKNPSTLAQLMDLFKRRLMTKHYLALVHGKLEPSTGFVRLPMARNPYNRHQFTIDPLGKVAHTEYEVMAFYTKPHAPVHSSFYSLVRLAPKTGRTHQIRVHCKAIGHPLVADALYASKNQLAADLEWCQRHFLHASSLALTHPQTHQPIAFEAPLPEDLVEALAQLTPVAE